MKKLKVLPIIICLILLFTGCGTTYIGGDRNTKWQKDLTYLSDSLKLKHPNLFFKISEEEFNDRINDLKSNVQNLSDEEIENNIYKIVASIGDAHTKAIVDYDKRFPVQFYYFKDYMYLINTTEDYRKALNCKLLKVNDKDIKDVVEILKPLVAAENESNIKKTVPTFLARPDILEGAKVIDSKDSVKFTFEDSDKNQFELEVKQVGAKYSDNDIEFINKDYDETYPLYMQDSDSSYWYKYLEDSKTLYFKYNSCMKIDEDKLDSDFTEILKDIDENKINKLVIDLRNNGGGSDGYLNPLIDGIKERQINSPDKLYVIVNRGTFSAAVINACTLREDTNATFIGEPTSNKPNHYGATTKILLPNNEVYASCSTKHVDIFNDNSDSLVPDKIIDMSIYDYVNKKDPVLDYILGIQE